MSLDLDKVFSALDEFEQLEIEIEAEARGISVHAVICDLVRKELAAIDMAAASQAGDSQWKSH